MREKFMEKEFNLQEYLSNGAARIVKDAIKASLKNPKESMFLAKFAKHTKTAKKIREEYNRKGQNIPIFLISSITSSCNLHCSGCYSRANHGCDDNDPVNQLSGEQWENIFTQAKDIGISFIVLAGGEPMLREDVITGASKFHEILFPIFTNGTMLKEDYLKPVIALYTRLLVQPRLNAATSQGGLSVITTSSRKAADAEARRELQRSLKARAKFLRQRLEEYLDEH